jgi:hypothetical protein
MSSELLGRARSRPGSAALIAAVCIGALGGCAQPAMAPGAMFGATSMLCADQAGPSGHVVVAKRRDFDCGTNAYASWEWRDLRGAKPGETVMVCRDPTIAAGQLPRGWVATGHTDVSIACGPWGGNERVQVRYQP